MSYLARGPRRGMGIDGKANAPRRRPLHPSASHLRPGGDRMSYLARGPMCGMGIDRKANVPGGRLPGVGTAMAEIEVAA